MTFLCVADADMGHRVPYAFLNDIKDRFFGANIDWQAAKVRASLTLPSLPSLLLGTGFECEISFGAVGSDELLFLRSRVGQNHQSEGGR